MKMISIVGPTACGKTTLAVALARRLRTEIISGDSRQVYRRMNLGTGKDLDEYTEGGAPVPVHLVDIVEPGSKFTVYDFQSRFLEAYRDMERRGLSPVFCGGSGLYVESVLRSYRLSPVPANPALREALAGKSLPELTALLASMKSLHNTTDVDSCQRAIRAIEIETYYRENPLEPRPFPQIDSLVVGLDVPRDVRRNRITRRLYQRLQQGMLREVRQLLEEGIQPDDLIYYGLEYKYLTLYLIGRLSYAEMCRQLEIAIHQFAKRQMTWFRGMQKRGVEIHWIDTTLSTDEKVERILALAQE